MQPCSRVAPGTPRVDWETLLALRGGLLLFSEAVLQTRPISHSCSVKEIKSRQRKVRRPTRRACAPGMHLSAGIFIAFLFSVRLYALLCFGVLHQHYAQSPRGCTAAVDRSPC